MPKKFIEHPLENVLGIDAGAFPVLPDDMDLVPLSRPVEYDEKDSEIEQDMGNVYTKAMSTFNAIAEDLGVGDDPRFRNRTAEVAAQLLNTALAAAKERMNLKQHKDKLTLIPVGGNKGGKIVNNNLFVDRNDLLRVMAQDTSKEAKAS